ncbi:MAG TPA: AbrB/MazE/SpoVT family DNA-binding domain-containing protein [Actinomycetota bacterium]
MKSTIRRWGNSLGLRIPKVFAQQAGLRDGSPVDIALEDHALIIRPLLPLVEDLDQLLRGVTRSNIHESVDTGTPTGREVW